MSERGGEPLPDFAGEHPWTIDMLLQRDARLRDERDRAAETRENANRVSVRVELENQQLRSALRTIRDTYVAWVRLFNRLEGAVAHHRKADKLVTESWDEALYAAHDRVLKEAANGR